jgi:hypothetical protein
MAVELEHKQAILLRLFTSFFGKEKIMFNISLWMLLEDFKELGIENKEEYKNYKCEIVILSKEDMPRMVVEFDPLYEKQEFIDLKNIKKDEVLKEVLQKAGIPYITVQKEEFEYLTHPHDRVSIVDYLNYKLGLDE